MSCQYILTMASGVWQDLGNPSDISPTYISGWFTNESNIGKLNNHIYTCFSGSSGCITPSLGAEEQSIYCEIYKINYYNKRIIESLGAGGIQWTELRDGDSTVRRANPTEASKAYIQMKKLSDENLTDLIASYKIKKAAPRTIDYANP